MKKVLYRCLVGLCFLWVLAPTSQGQSLSNGYFLPYIVNGQGVTVLPAANAYNIAFIAADGAWLINADGSGKIRLTDSALLTGLIFPSPAGDQIAIDTGSGWSVFDRQGTRLADRVGAGTTLRWHHDNHSLLLARINHGIDRYDLTTSQSAPYIATTDETNDHSPLWSTNHQQLLFAHQEFGEKLFVTLINNFDVNKIPYIGENHTGAKLNPNFTLLLETVSWHDQTIDFHWASNEQKVVFGAKTAIHVIDRSAGKVSKIEPPGFGQRDSGRMIDVANERIVYVGADGIYAVDLQGQNHRQLAPGNDLHYPRWTPTEDTIIFTGADHFLYLVDLFGNQPIVIPNTTGAQHFAVFKATNNVR